MRIFTLVATCFVVALAACSSSSTSSTAVGPQDPGVGGEGDTVANSAPDKNEDGDAYPTDNIGTVPHKGSTPGNRIANFKFLGFPNGDTTGGLKPISLAQYFDPNGKRYKVIHIQASGVWCGYCQAETETVAQMKADLDARGAVWLMSLAEGRTQGTPATQKDLEGWIKNFKAPYTQWLDPGNEKLGPFYRAEALPWNANIDPRTMEILTAHEGAAVEKADILKDIDDAIEKTKTSKLLPKAAP